MNKLIPTALVLLACSLVLMMPADECDAERYSVQFHDEFHGDFWLNTDDNGLLSYDQLQDPRLVPAQEGYIFQGWFYPNGDMFAPGMKIYNDTYVISHYEKIKDPNAISDNALMAILFVICVVIVAAILFMVWKRKN